MALKDGESTDVFGLRQSRGIVGTYIHICMRIVRGFVIDSSTDRRAPGASTRQLSNPYPCLRSPFVERRTGGGTDSRPFKLASSR